MKERRHRNSLPAASLVEVLVSLTLASIVFVIAAAVWLQIAGPLSAPRQLSLRLNSRKLLQQAIDQQSLENTTFVLDGATFVRKVHAINPSNQLYRIDITVESADGGAPKFRRSKIVRYHEAEGIHID